MKCMHILASAGAFLHKGVIQPGVAGALWGFSQLIGTETAENVPPGETIGWPVFGVVCQQVPKLESMSFGPCLGVSMQ